MPKVNQAAPESPAEDTEAPVALLPELVDDLDLPEGEVVSFEALTQPGALTDLVDETEYSSSLALPASGGFGFDAKPQFDQSEIEIYRLKLLQGQSPELAQGIGRVGHWFLQGQEEAFETVTFLPVGMMRNRELRPKNTDGSMGIVQCRSSDGVTGIGTPGGACQVCPLQQWGERDPNTGKGTPPACSQIWVYLGVALEYEEVCVLSFQKTATKAAKWMNAMATRKDGFGSFAVKFGSKLEKNGKTQWFVPTYTIATVPMQDLANAKALLG